MLAISSIHPSNVYLNGQRLSHALLPFLGAALFGAERTSYWQRCLEAAADTGPAAPAADCVQELEAEIADLERRLER